MNRLALAIRMASEDALSQVSLESLASDAQSVNNDYDNEIASVEEMTALACGLDAVVTSLESIDNPTPYQRTLARNNAVSCLKLSGLSEAEIEDIFPSMEADAQKSGWERFKAFLVRLWELIASAAKKIYTFVDDMLKRSSLAEKAAMAQLRALRIQLTQKTAGLTIEPKIKLRAAHRYLSPCQMNTHPANLTSSSTIRDLTDLKQSIQTFQHNRDLFQSKLPEITKKVIEDLAVIVNGLALGGTDEQIAESVGKNIDALKKAIAPMFPDGLKRALGVSDYTIPLIYDRVLTIHDPAPGEDYFQLSDTDFKNLVSQLGMTVDQIEHAEDPTDMGEFPALRINEIGDLLKLATSLIDEGYSADQPQKWRRLKSLSQSLGYDIRATIRVVLKRETLSQESRLMLTAVLNANQALDKWIAGPFLQINTVNIRVVDALLALASDQLKNYDVKDSRAEELPPKPAKAAEPRGDKQRSSADREDKG